MLTIWIQICACSFHHYLNERVSFRALIKGFCVVNPISTRSLVLLRDVSVCKTVVDCEDDQANRTVVDCKGDQANRTVVDCEDDQANR